MNYDSLIELISHEYGIRVTDLRLCPDYQPYLDEPERFMRQSYIIGGDEMILGLYDDQQERFAAFLHEVGHTTVPKEVLHELGNSELMYPWSIERAAWQEAEQLAKDYGVEFTLQMARYRDRSLDSYNREERWSFEGRSHK